MSMPTFHFYDTLTGFFVGSFTGLQDDLEHNTPNGAGVWETNKSIDHTAHKLCLKSGTLLTHTCAATAVDPRVDSERQIMQIEVKHARALRETVLAMARGLPPPAYAISLLSKQDAIIGNLRKTLASEKPDNESEAMTSIGIVPDAPGSQSGQ